MSDVRLVSATANPLETLWVLWQTSRDPQFQMTVEEVKQTVPHADMEELFRKIVATGLPVAENISFNFILENISVALREQVVRHRIGVKVGDNFGVDYVADLHDSSYWSQSMRALSMEAFYDKGGFDEPDSIRHNPNAHAAYLDAMSGAQHVYKQLCELGIPVEDARMVIPLATTHSISWTLNLAALRHILPKRSCWILQLGFWKPIVFGMIRELKRLSPVFTQLALPPCRCNADREFTGCPFKLDNEYRIRGIDPLPPCPLFLEHNFDLAVTLSQRLESAWKWDSVWRKWYPSNPHDLVIFEQMSADYETHWNSFEDGSSSVANYAQFERGE